MGIYAESKSEFKIPPAGTYLARCIGMIEIGTVVTEFAGEERTSHRVNITWELPEEQEIFDPDKGPQPFVVSKEYNLSMHEQSALRKDLESWRGRGYTPEEAKRLDITKLLGQPCILTVVHQPGKKDPSRMYPKIENISKLMKNQVCPPQVNPTKILCFEDFDWEVFSSLPDFLKDKIKQSEEFRQLQSPGSVHNEAENDYDDGNTPPF